MVAALSNLTGWHRLFIVTSLIWFVGITIFYFAKADSIGGETWQQHHESFRSRLDACVKHSETLGLDRLWCSENRRRWLDETDESCNTRWKEQAFSSCIALELPINDARGTSTREKVESEQREFALFCLVLALAVPMLIYALGSMTVWVINGFRRRS